MNRYDLFKHVYLRIISPLTYSKNQNTLPKYSTKIIDSKYRKIVNINYSYIHIHSIIVFTKIMIALNCSDYMLIKHRFFFCSKIIFSRVQLSTINVNMVVVIMIRIHFQMIELYTQKNMSSFILFEISFLNYIHKVS